ncbi:MAG: fused MFS/spermidine synthase [Gammaproteobacteria bacterium]|nr:fused MFS/spermidine synthase [Gammaproteobacteria bacterium]
MSAARSRGATVRVIEGDARLTLNNARDDSYDLLVVDAFTSGSIPIHLITRETIQLYQRKLKAEAVIAYHVSNHYLDFKGPLCNLAGSIGLACLSKLDLVQNPEYKQRGRVMPNTW